MASMNEKDYYAILEVDEKATTDEIRRAFQKKARRLHPDVNKEPDAEDRFKEVSEAYAVLSDDDKRKRYDAMRSGVPFAGGYSGGSSAGGYGGSPFGEGFPFSGAWQSSSRSSRSYNPRAGADVVYQLDLDDETAKAGVRRGVTYQRYAACDVCHGAGSVEHSHATTCPTCGGAGRIRVDLGGMGLFGLGLFEVRCPECEGSGKVVTDPCSSCGGTGRVLTATEIVIDVPANSHDGDEVRIEGMGNAGTNGRESGDFVCRVGVASERLEPQQEVAFRFLGFGLPFVVIGFVQASLLPIAVVGAVIMGVGIAMLVRSGVNMNGTWWRQGLTTLVSGACTGLIIGLLLMFSGPFLYSIAPFVLFVLFFSLMTRRR